VRVATRLVHVATDTHHDRRLERRAILSRREREHLVRQGEQRAVETNDDATFGLLRRRMVRRPDRWVEGNRVRRPLVRLRDRESGREPLR
jgi:hypothetical protein